MCVCVHFQCDLHRVDLQSISSPTLTEIDNKFFSLPHPSIHRSREGEGKSAIRSKTTCVGYYYAIRRLLPPPTLTRFLLTTLTTLRGIIEFGKFEKNRRRQQRKERKEHFYALNVFYNAEHAHTHKYIHVRCIVLYTLHCI